MAGVEPLPPLRRHAPQDGTRRPCFGRRPRAPARGLVTVSVRPPRLEVRPRGCRTALPPGLLPHAKRGPKRTRRRRARTHGLLDNPTESQIEKRRDDGVEERTGEDRGQRKWRGTYKIRWSEEHGMGEE